ncbi:hypothetical protein B7494_g2881 [Chlorociboria aeruginascens]|nr:hypothetical protein B7494_g2881 [Chlorociboria aeruginascens]
MDFCGIIFGEMAEPGSEEEDKTTPNATPPATIYKRRETDKSAVSSIPVDHLKTLLVTWAAVVVGAVASIGGFIFGYEPGGISARFSLPYLLQEP